MTVVFDTNVLISATLWDGSVAQKLLFRLISAGIKIFSSPEILSEYQKVLQKEFGYTADEVAHIMEKVMAFVSVVEPTVKVKVVKDDSEDDKIIECALASSSRHIISYDKHLLRLKEYGEINIIKPEEALRKEF